MATASQFIMGMGSFTFYSLGARSLITVTVQFELLGVQTLCGALMRLPPCLQSWETHCVCFSFLFKGQRSNSLSHMAVHSGVLCVCVSWFRRTGFYPSVQMRRKRGRVPSQGELS